MEYSVVYQCFAATTGNFHHRLAGLVGGQPVPAPELTTAQDEFRHVVLCRPGLGLIPECRSVGVVKGDVFDVDGHDGPIRSGFGIIVLAVETTGTLKKREDAAQHLQCGAKKVVVSAPCKEADATIVMGVNDDIYDAAAHTVLSAASCTTNCLAPVAKVLNDAFGIRHGLMTTIHSYTMSQRILDGSHKDLRRARAACVSMIPTSTGAAKALALVVPALKGKLDGMAVRVPTPDISLVDLTCELEKPATAEEINAALKAAHDGALHDNMGYCDEPLVSIDFKGSTHGGVVDALSTQVMDGTMAKLIIWYDNESGFTNQLARLLRKVAASL